MEVNQYLHTRLRCPPSNFYCSIYIIVTTAITIAACIIRIIPYADAYIIDSAVVKQIKKSLIVKFISLKIVIFNTAVFFSNIGGDIDTSYEVIRESVYFIHPDACFNSS